MKKSLLLAAALFATTSAFAVDVYIVGSDVNGKSWSLAEADAKMNETSPNVYEWSGQTLGDGFKFNDGTWSNANYNIGSNGQLISLDTPYTVNVSGDSGDIKFNGFGLLTNPTVKLDLNTKILVINGTPGAAVEPEPIEDGFYMIGSNVNGKEWSLAEKDAKFEDLGNGVYRWTGDLLGTGFKINDGTWDHEEWNIGGNGDDILMNSPYTYTTGGSSPNISFLGFTEIVNPVVELNINEGVNTITIIDGVPGGKSQWYIPGFNQSSMALSEDVELFQVGDSNVYENVFYLVETVGGCKISDTGWSHQYGTNFPEDNYIDAAHTEIFLETVGSEGNIPYELEEGAYKVTFDLDELMLTIAPDSGVEGVAADVEANAVYYNLQGLKVNNPVKGNGILVKIVNGKSSKVVK